MTGWIGISLGDITGIGPEVTLKALGAEAGIDDTRYLLIGDPDYTQALNRQLGLDLPLQPYTGRDEPGWIFQMKSTKTGPLPAGLVEGSPAAAQAAVAWVREGAELCVKQRLDALVTAPVNKEAIV